MGLLALDVPRHIQTEFETQLTEYPIVTLVGPRQAGKTTLARTALPDYAYVNLENPVRLYKIGL